MDVAAALQFFRQPDRLSRPRSSSRCASSRCLSRHASGRASSPSADVLWYHQNFGDHARRYTSPCTWEENARVSTLTGLGDLGEKASGLHFVTDMLTRRRFMVAVGAQIIVLPTSHADRRRPYETFALQAANRFHIVSYGLRSLTLNIGLRRVFPCVFVVADVAHPILRYDSLCDFKLGVSIRLQCLVDSLTILYVQGLSSSGTTTGICALLPTYGYCNFRSITKPCNRELGPSRPIPHHIITSGPLAFFRRRQLFGERLEIARREFDHMLQLGIIRLSPSSWASPLHMVPKKDPGDWRPCGDYHALNPPTILDKCPLPNTQDFTINLSETTIFSKIELVRAYSQIPVPAEDIQKPRSSLHLDHSNISECHLVCGTQLRPFRYL